MKKSMIEINTDETLQALAEVTHGITGGKYGFVIILAPFEGKDDSVTHYVSNINSSDVSELLRESAKVIDSRAKKEAIFMTKPTNVQ